MKERRRDVYARDGAALPTRLAATAPSSGCADASMVAKVRRREAPGREVEASVRHRRPSRRERRPSWTPTEAVLYPAPRPPVPRRWPPCTRPVAVRSPIGRAPEGYRAATQGSRAAFVGGGRQFQTVWARQRGARRVPAETGAAARSVRPRSLPGPVLARSVTAATRVRAPRQTGAQFACRPVRRESGPARYRRARRSWSSCRS